MKEKILKLLETKSKSVQTDLDKLLLIDSRSKVTSLADFLDIILITASQSTYESEIKEGLQGNKLITTLDWNRKDSGIQLNLSSGKIDVLEDWLQNNTYLTQINFTATKMGPL